MNNLINLNEKYSTTRFLTKKQPVIIKENKDQFESILFFPNEINRKGEGGLRKKGYFKKSQKNKPLISIVTIVYNGEEYLEKTIKSIINQTYSNLEYIIIDGGSSDKTIDIIKKYEGMIDYWISEKDKGISDAFNKGIMTCQGEIINLLNAGDTLINESILENNVIHFKHGINIASTLLNNNILKLNYSYYKFGMFLPHPSTFILSKVYKEIGLYSIKYKYAMDYEFFLRAIKYNITFDKNSTITTIMDDPGQSSALFKCWIEELKAKKQVLHNYYLIFSIYKIVKQIVYSRFSKFLK
jgi:glycosyltransferase involved in cell wall biosynthesis